VLGLDDELDGVTGVEELLDVEDVDEVLDVLAATVLEDFEVLVLEVPVDPPQVKGLGPGIV